MTAKKPRGKKPTDKARLDFLFRKLKLTTVGTVYSTGRRWTEWRTGRIWCADPGNTLTRAALDAAIRESKTGSKR